MMCLYRCTKRSRLNRIHTQDFLNRVLKKKWWDHVKTNNILFKIVMKQNFYDPVYYELKKSLHS